VSLLVFKREIQKAQKKLVQKSSFLAKLVDADVQEEATAVGAAATNSQGF
jgi:hypothetical protein